MKETLQRLATILGTVKLFAENFTWKRFLIAIILLIAIGLGSVLGYNYFTGNLYFNRINQKIEVIEKLETKIDKDYFTAKVEKAYNEILTETAEYDTKKYIKIDISDRLKKILVALIIPILALILIPNRLLVEANTILGILLFGGIFGGIAAIIPDIHSLLLTCIIIFVSELLFLLILPSGPKEVE